MTEAKDAKTASIDSQHVAQHTIWLAESEAEKEKFATVSQDGDSVFHVHTWYNIGMEQTAWHYTHLSFVGLETH